MARIRPFHALRYDLDGEELSRVVAPPYDVISPAYRDALYARDPRNVIRMVLNRTLGDAGYAEAGATLERLRGEGTIVRDEIPRLFVLEQEFVVEGASRRRFGVIGSCLAEDLEAGTILPHEHTRAAAKEDRWRKLQTTRANFSPIFLMHDDPAGTLAAALAAVSGGDPIASFTDDASVKHRLFGVDGKAVVDFEALLATGLTYIADGHHRYATALRYRDTIGPDGAWTLAYFVPLQDRGLVVQPYHRVVALSPPLDWIRDRLARWFDLRDGRTLAEAARAVARSDKPHAFALAEKGGRVLVAEANPEAASLLPADVPPALAVLDTYFLHQAVLHSLLRIPEESIHFVHALAEAESALEEEGPRLAVLMRGTPVEQIKAVADARLSMPPKSTYFHPKLPSGLVIHEVASP